MQNMKTHYINCNTRLPTYYPLPQFVFDLKISATAKLLYALLLYRMTLSQFNQWVDGEGRVYIVYPIEELANAMHKGTTAIKNALRELSDCGLLERVRVDYSKAKHLYLKFPKDIEMVGKQTVIETEKRPANGRKSVHKTGGNRPTSKYTNTLNNSNRRDIRTMDYSYEEGESL